MNTLNKYLNFEFLFIFLLIQLFIIFLTFLRAKRLKNLDVKLIKKINKINILDVNLYISFTRLISFVLPFKIGEVISFYIIKKKIINFFSSALSYLIGCKFFELFFLLIISLFVCLIFFLETQLIENSKLFIRLIYLLIIVILFLLLNYLKNNKNKILKINFKNVYINSFKILINSNSFFSYTFYISSVQFLCTILLLFICSDRSIDNELFFLSTIYILLNLMPIRLPLNVGVFDIFAGFGNYIYSYGLSIENLILFRVLQLILYLIDFIFWYVINKSRLSK